MPDIIPNNISDPIRYALIESCSAKLNLLDLNVILENRAITGSISIKSTLAYLFNLFIASTSNDPNEVVSLAPSVMF